MRRFTSEEVTGILSRDHLQNTAIALNKREDEVSAEELVEHWMRFHAMTVTTYTVDESEVLFV